MPFMQDLFSAICVLVAVAVVFSLISSRHIRRRSAETEEASRQPVLSAAEKHFRKGESYEKGNEGRPQDVSQAFNWYRIAAEQGHSGAQYKISLMYRNGEGTLPDGDQAHMWLQRSAEQGHPAACYDLGNYFSEELADPGKAVDWFLKAAEREHAAGAYALALCYDSGSGVEKDAAEALKWYRIAANRGYGPALEILRKKGARW